MSFTYYRFLLCKSFVACHYRRGSFMQRKISCRNHLKSRRNRQGRSPVALALSKSVFRQWMLVKDCWREMKISDEEEKVLQARCHYSQAQVDDVLYNLNDAAFIKEKESRITLVRLWNFLKLQTRNFTPRHNGFSKQKILLSKINLICMIQDVFSYRILRMSTYLTVSSLRLVFYEFL